MHKNKILKGVVKKKVKSKIISIEKFTESCLYGKFGYYNNSDVIGKKVTLLLLQKSLNYLEI